MRAGNFFQIDNCIFDFKLSPIEFYVYCYLHRCNNPARGCFPSKKTIARACGISVSSVSKAIALLDGAGLAKRQVNYRDGRQMNNSYTLPPLVLANRALSSIRMGGVDKEMGKQE